jgi:hypothetical protein
MADSLSDQFFWLNFDLRLSFVRHQSEANMGLALNVGRDVAADVRT